MALRHTFQRLAALLLDRVLDFVIDGAVGELVKRRDGVGVTGFDDQQGNQKAADGVEPRGVVQEVGAEDGEEGDDSRERVDAVVHGVGG